MNAKHQKIVNSKSYDEWVAAIKQWIHNETDRAMLKRQLLDGKTIEAIAEENDLSTVQTQKRLQKAREQLFSHI